MPRFAPLFAVLSLLLLIAACSAVSIVQYRKGRGTNWPALSARFGLSRNGDVLEGSVDELIVRIRPGVSLGARSAYPWTRVSISQGLPTGLGIERRRWLFRTGVSDIDRALSCSGRVEILHSLSANGRIAIVRAARLGWKLRSGVLELEAPGQSFGKLEVSITHGLAAARALRALPDEPSQERSSS